MRTTVTMEFGPDDDVEGWFYHIRNNQKIHGAVCEWLRAVRNKIKYVKPDEIENMETWEQAYSLMFTILEEADATIDY